MKRVVINGMALGLGAVGQGVYSQRLLRLLEKIPDLELILLLPEGSETSTGLPGKKIKIPGWQKTGGWVGSIYWSNRLAAHAARHFPDDVYLCPTPAWAFWRPKKTIIVVHDVIYRCFPKYEGKWLIRKLMNRLCEFYAAGAWKVATVSEFSKNQIASLTRIPANIIHPIPNWIEDRFLELAKQTDPVGLRKKYNLPERYWLYVGGYDYRKNLECLIAAYAGACLKAECPPLVLAGKIPTDLSKPYCDVYGSIARFGLKKTQVLTTGFVLDDDLPGVYRGADLFIFPSLMEGFGYGPAEAMAVETPVLVSNTSSLPEVVSREDCRFDPEKPQDLEARLVRAAADPEQFALPLSSDNREAHATLLFRKCLEV